MRDTDASAETCSYYESSAFISAFSPPRETGWFLVARQLSCDLRTPLHLPFITIVSVTRAVAFLDSFECNDGILGFAGLGFNTERVGCVCARCE